MNFRNKRLYSLLQNTCKALFYAYTRTFIRSKAIAIRITVFGVLSSLFEILGTALSMQALISTIADSRSLKAGNHALGSLGYDYRFNSDTIVLAVIFAMVVSYTLSIVLASFKERNLRSFRISKQLDHYPDKDGSIFVSTDYVKDLKIADALIKSFETLILAIILLIFMFWLSIGFGFTIFSILLIYFLAIILSQKKNAAVRSSVRAANKKIKNRERAKKKLEVKRYYRTHELAKTYFTKKAAQLQFIFLLCMILLVSMSAVLFDPGQLLVMPLLVILAVRKLLGSAKTTATQFVFLLEPRQ